MSVTLWKQYCEIEISIMGYCPISRDSEPSNCSILWGSHVAYTNIPCTALYSPEQVGNNEVFLWTQGAQVAILLLVPLVSTKTLTYLFPNGEQNKCDILHPRWNNNNTKMFCIAPSLLAVTPCLERVAALRAGQGSPATRPAPQVTMERTAGSPVTVPTEPTATASPVPAYAHRATWWVQFICTSFVVHLKFLCSS